MKHISNRTFASMALVLASACLLVAGGPVALAREGESGGGSNTGSTSGSGGSGSGRPTTPESTQPGTTADDNPSTSDTTEGSGKNRVRTEDNGSGLNKELKDAREKATGKLDEARKNICQQKANNARVAAGHVNSSLQIQLEKFTQIYQRVDQFKTSKNLTVANYDALLAAVKAKQAAAEAAVQAAKTTQAVDCSGDNAAGQANTNKATFTAARNALKELRTAIKALISAVRSALPKTEDKPATTTPTTNTQTPTTQQQGVTQ